jgi:hypothetical protein
MTLLLAAELSTATSTHVPITVYADCSVCRKSCWFRPVLSCHLVNHLLFIRLPRSMKFHPLSLYALLHILLGCTGWVSHIRNPKLTCIRCKDGISDPTPSDMRSRFNEKMLNEAKKLREEASELEKVDKLQLGQHQSPPAEEEKDLNDASERKTFRKDFVSNFPSPKQLNTDELTLNGTSSNFSSVVALGEQSADSYVSVLAERAPPTTEEESYLQKIVDIGRRGMQEQDPVDATPVSGSAMEDLSASIMRGRETKGSSSNELMRALDDLIEIKLKEEYQNSGKFYDPSNIRKPPVATVLPASSSKYVVEDPRGKANNKLASISDALQSPFITFGDKLLLRLILLLFSTDVADKTSARNVEDIKILEMSLVCFLRLFAERDPEEMSPSVYFKNFEFRLYMIADWLRYELKQEVPTVEEIQKLLPNDFASGDVSFLTLWRLATIRRLCDMTEEAAGEREAVWGTKSELQVEDPPPAILNTTKIDPSTNTNERGLLGRLNDYLDRQLVNAEEDLAEVRGAGLNKATPMIKKAVENTEQGQGQDSILRAIGVNDSLSPAMQALRGALNSTMPASARIDDSQSSSPDENSGDKSRRAAELDMVGVTNRSSSNSDAYTASTTVMASQEKKGQDMNATNLLKQLIGIDIGTLSAAVDQLDEQSTAAEMFISNYFDDTSKILGKVISKQGAGRFQAEMLRDIFVVTSVKVSRGAYIFDGKYKTKTSSEFVEKLEQRYAGSRMSEEVGYTVMMNVKYPNPEDTQQQQVMDQLQGETPAIVVFPRSWNPSTGFYGTAGLKNVIAAAAVASCSAFAASCYGMFNSGSPFMTSGSIPDGLIPLSLLPLGIQYASTSAEAFAAKQKGFNISSSVLPSFSLFNFGSRSVCTSMPKNRNDAFDTAAIGISVALLGSLITLCLGLYITASATSEVLASYPSVSLTLLDTNAVVRQAMEFKFPAIFEPLAAAKVATNLIYGGDGEGGGDAQVHLHWLAIAGGVSFIGSTLQLFPFDNSAGSRMSSAVLGRINYGIFVIIFGALKAIFIIPMLFNFAASGLVTTARLLTDYFLTSSFLLIGQVTSYVPRFI